MQGAEYITYARHRTADYDRMAHALLAEQAGRSADAVSEAEASGSRRHRRPGRGLVDVLRHALAM